MDIHKKTNIYLSSIRDSINLRYLHYSFLMIAIEYINTICKRTIAFYRLQCIISISINVLITCFGENRENKILSQSTCLSREKIARQIAQHMKSITYIGRNTGGGYEVDPPKPWDS